MEEPKIDRKKLRVRHPWHAVDYGAKAPEIVNCITEIPKRSKAKYELDKDSGMLKLDRVLFSSIHYPANYGFIPQTYCEDDDPLDILVLSSVDVVPMCLLEAKVIGAMQMIDDNEQDDKIIAVANNDVSVNFMDDLSNLPQHTMDEMQRFFEDYKKLENKEVTVERFIDKKESCRIINESIELYKEKFVP